MGTIRQSHPVKKDAGASSRSNGGSSGDSEAPSPKALRLHLQRFPKTSVLVIGDLILDHYVMGRVSRISPEAPVPVVHVESESLRLGGAANVYSNILALGGKAHLCGVIGADQSGKQLVAELGHTRGALGGIVVDRERPTTRKSRVIAHNQQIVRYDIEGRSELKAVLRQKILRYVESKLRELSCIVVSDYAKGVVSSVLMSEITRLAVLRRVPVIVDPKVEHFNFYKGVTVITPNHLEATQASGMHGDDNQTINEAGAMIRQRLGCQSVLITRGEKGMSLYEGDGASCHLPTKARQVYDVTGAGDTVIGTLALALAAGADIKTGAIMANHAAGIVVGMVGTATVSPKQLSEAFGDD
jgi:rfaE bifunctional protein kinase chain/domain